MILLKNLSFVILLNVVGYGTSPCLHAMEYDKSSDSGRIRAFPSQEHNAFLYDVMVDDTDIDRTALRKRKMGDDIRILCIDGGAIRGIIPAMILANLEAKTKKPISALFDIIVGTSTGGLIASLLSVKDTDGSAKYLARDVVKLFETQGAEIFTTSYYHTFTSGFGYKGPKYKGENLSDIATKYLGNETLANTRAHLVVTAYDTTYRRDVEFKSRKARRNNKDNYYLRDVCCATASAPTYFPSYHISNLSDVDHEEYDCIDGGVFANNPTIFGIVEGIKIFRAEERVMVQDMNEDYKKHGKFKYLQEVFENPKMSKEEKFLSIRDSSTTWDGKISVCSLGTGSYTRPFSREDTENWGVLGWARPILDVMFHGQSESAHMLVKNSFSHKGPHRTYYRLQVTLGSDNDVFDDTNPMTIQKLKNEVQKALKTDEYQAIYEHFGK